MYKLPRFFLQVGIVIGLYLAGVLFVACLPWSYFVVMAVIAKMVAPKLKLWKMGTNRWAVRSDIKDTDAGLILGRLEGTQRIDWKAPFNAKLRDKDACRRFLYPKNNIVRLDAIHTAVFAPTRAGKGASLVVPFLLTCEDSCVVIDMKGELAQLTAGTRAKMGHDVVILDPFKTLPTDTATLNSLDFCGGADDAKDIAKSLVIREEKEDGNSGHFKDAAEMWIAAMIALAIEHGQAKDKNLQMVQDMLTDPARMKLAVSMLERSGGVLARMGHQLGFFTGEEKGSTLTTTARFMRWLDSPAIAENVRSTSFDPEQLKKGKMTVYIVPSLEHSKVMAPWIRMVIAVLLKVIMRQGLGEEKKVHFVLDEASALGHMDVIDDALDKGAGYGIRCQWYFQSIGQISKCFPGQETTLLSNVSKVFFAPNDMKFKDAQGTAEYISSMLGSETVTIESGGTSMNRQTSSTSGQHFSSTRGSSWSRTDNWAQHKRELLQPAEVLQLPPRTAITFTPGVPPIKTTLIRWYEEKRLFRRGFRDAFMLWFGALFFVLWMSFLAWSGTHIAKSFKGSGFNYFTKGAR